MADKSRRARRLYAAPGISRGSTHSDTNRRHGYGWAQKMTPHLSRQQTAKTPVSPRCQFAPKAVRKEPTRPGPRGGRGRGRSAGADAAACVSPGVEAVGGVGGGRGWCWRNGAGASLCSSRRVPGSMTLEEPAWDIPPKRSVESGGVGRGPTAADSRPVASGAARLHVATECHPGNHCPHAARSAAET